MTGDALAYVLAALALLGSVYVGALLERGGFFDWWHGDE